MLVHDDSIAPNMSVERNTSGALQRSSWKAEAIRRGDLKISGPIPITEDTPLNEEEEREFEKHGTLSPTLPLDTSAGNDPHDVPDPPQSPPPAPLADQAEVLEQDPVQQEDQPQVLNQQRQSPPKQLLLRMQNTAEGHRRSATEPVSIASTFTPTPDTVRRSSTKKKRKSGLRNVFRKMFGRRSRDVSEEREEESQTVQPAQTPAQPQRASVNGVTRATSERQPPIHRGGRISELNVEEPKPINPLGQHLPFPMNVNAPQEASPDHEYLRFEAPTPTLVRRRATLPNVHVHADTQSLNGRDRRMDTWEERPDGASIPSPEIGIALSSPTHARQFSAHSIQSKRKSRSAGDLRELAAKGRLSTERRRSDEIRYWRSSHASGSVYSSHTPRPHTAQTVETAQDEAEKEDLPKLEDVVTRSVSVHAPTVVEVQAHVQVQAHDQDISQIQLPVEAFNFGNLRSDFSDTEAEEEPEERTHTPPPAPLAEPQPRLSIEDRVRYLEDNMRTLDASVRRLSQSDRTTRSRSNQTIILENAPKSRRASRNRSSSASSHSQRQGSHHSSSKSSNHILHLRAYETLSEPTSHTQVPSSPPLSAVTELPSTIPASQTASLHDLSTSASESPSPAHQLSLLTASLHHERHARKQLERRVESLAGEVADLQALVRKMVSVARVSYPTPSPDGVVSGQVEEKTPRGRGEGGVDGRGGDRMGDERESLEGSRRVSVDGEVGSPEAWATPKEMGGLGFF